MARLSLYSTVSGTGFNMNADWVTKTFGSLQGPPPYTVETATISKGGLNSSNFTQFTYSAPRPVVEGEYDSSNSTLSSFKAVDAGKTIFTVSEINISNSLFDSGFADYFEAHVPPQATDQQIATLYSVGLFSSLLQKSDTITGTAYADVITSFAGVDTVNAGGGGDKVYGGTSGDILNGGSSNDQLFGESGKDRLTGGTGYDKFVFSAALSATTNVDVITDFSVAYDEIYLDNDVFTKAGAIGQLKADAFHKGTSAADAEDRIIYNSSNGYLYYDRDGTGSTYSKVLFADLAAGLKMTYLDFEVIG